MNRLQKKCVIVTAGVHLLLLVILLVGPAFFSPRPKVDDIQVLTVIPAMLVDAPFSSGVANAAPPPEPVAPPQPPPPEPVPVSPPTAVSPPRTFKVVMPLPSDVKAFAGALTVQLLVGVLKVPPLVPGAVSPSRTATAKPEPGVQMRSARSVAIDAGGEPVEVDSVTSVMS